MKRSKPTARQLRAIQREQAAIARLKAKAAAMDGRPFLQVAAEIEAKAFRATREAR